MGQLLSFQRTVSHAAITFKSQGLPHLLHKSVRTLGARAFGEPFFNRDVCDAIARLIQISGARSFIDVGANVGNIGVTIAPLVRQTILVEPYPQHVEKLRRRVAARNLPRCDVVECAAGEKDGTVRLQVSPTNLDDIRVLPGPELNVGPEVQLRTLDSIVREAKALPPFVIKMDVQGSEPQVYAGAREVMKATPALVFELYPWAMKAEPSSPRMLLERLSADGFGIDDLYFNTRSATWLDRFVSLGLKDPRIMTDLVALR